MMPVLDRRRSGVLLHPAALPGEHGVLGQSAREFIDWLATAGFGVWQVLPLGPVGADGSPYWVRSDDAGNTALVDRSEAPDPQHSRESFAHFCEAQRGWLEDYVLFAALSREHAAAPWWTWPAALREREPEALREARQRLEPELQALRIAQWQFAQQWSALRDYARQRGVRLYGDLPIYLAPDSVATWTQRAQFQLSADGSPALLAGVPPDYFAADGQLWGNPLYDWEQARRDGFAFWRARVASQLRRFDLLRLDHFRGLAGYWAVPAGARTAREGQWLPAPGAELLAALRSLAAESTPGELPLVAEDLGVITPDVVALRRAFDLPGMRVLQFGFDGASDNPHLAHNFTQRSVVYTGTHDNDTTLGWYRALDSSTARRVDDYLGCASESMPLALVRAALASVAVLAVAPVQDLLALGSEARYNVPGTVGDNWRWRMSPGVLTRELASQYRRLNAIYGRLA
ncbi:MAG TPA: 4-alpha-glucanotransferase [Steroidobacteraceae bacterium]|nr:4-alpha-glucanotransferase [Steroidobacteraceae bacterium]